MCRNQVQDTFLLQTPSKHARESLADETSERTAQNEELLGYNYASSSLLSLSYRFPWELQTSCRSTTVVEAVLNQRQPLMRCRKELPCGRSRKLAWCDLPAHAPTAASDTQKGADRSPPLLWLSEICECPSGCSSTTHLEHTAVRAGGTLQVLHSHLLMTLLLKNNFVSFKLQNLGIGKRRAMLKKFPKEACLKLN